MESQEQLLDTILKAVEELPPMPSTVLELRRVIADPDVNYDRLAPIIKKDPSLCADLLKISNSAAIGVGHNVDTVDEAIRYFGVSSLVEFVAAACSEQIIQQSFASVNHLNEYTQHSRAVSLATAFMSEAFHLDQHDREVFTLTGLLHDIGRLVILLFTEEKEYCEEVLGLNWQEVHAMVATEKDIFGIDHAVLGQKICQKWQFPDRIINGVRMHHTPLIGNHIYKDGLILFLSEIITVESTPDIVLEMALPPGVLEKMGIKTSELIDAKHKYIEAAQKLNIAQNAD